MAQRPAAAPHVRPPKAAAPEEPTPEVAPDPEPEPEPEAEDSGDTED